MPKYFATVGMNYTVKGEKEELRVEIGEEVTGLSDKQIAELLELGDIATGDDLGFTAPEEKGK